MKISVVVPTYNRAAFLVDAIESALAQGDELYELIVVDDGSEDDTGEVVRGYVERFPRLVKYVRKANSGKAASLNMGLREVSGSHVLILDDDDLLTQGALRAHRAALEAAEDNTAFTYGRHVFFDNPDDVQETAEYEQEGSWGADDDRLFVWALESFRFYQQGTLIPLEAYIAVGPFDETLARVQDYDMMLRLCRRFPGVPVNRSVVAVRQHTGARGPAAERHSAKEMFSVWRRYDGIVLNRVRDAVPLAEYLGKARANDGKPLAPHEERRAFIQRAAIMARRGQFTNALDDLRAACDTLPGGKQITSEELRCLDGALALARYATLPPGTLRFFLRSYEPYRKLGGAAAVKVLRRRVYWSLYDRVRAWNLKEMAGLAGVFVALSVRDAPQAVTGNTSSGWEGNGRGN